MAKSITLTEPALKDKEEDSKRTIHPERVTMVFFTALLSPPNANSNLIYQGVVRSFRETPKQIAEMLSEHIRLLKLTVPKESNSPAKEIWINIKKILEVRKKGESSFLSLDGQKGTVTVLESKKFIDEALKAAEG